MKFACTLLLILFFGHCASAQEVAVQAIELEDLAELDFAQALPDADPQVMLLERYRQVRLALLRRVCELKAEQEAELEKIDRQWIVDEIRKISEEPNQRQGVVRGIVRFLGGRGAPQQMIQPRDVVRELRTRIAESMESVLDESQKSSLQVELAAREQALHEANTELVLCILDRHVFLSEEQRRKMRPDLMAWMKDFDREIYWQFYLQNNNYYPEVPHKILADHLEADQVTTLSRLHKFSYDAIDIELQTAQQQGADFVIAK